MFSTPSPFPVFKTPWLRARCLIVVAVLALFACSLGPSADEAALAERFGQMTQTTLHEIQTIHIEPEETATLTLAALDGLQRIAPRVTIAQQGDTIVARYLDGRDIARIATPQTTDPHAWAIGATQLVFQAREVDARLGAADEETLYDAFFGGMISRLDRYSRYAGRADAREARAEREGFGGIGVRIEDHPDGARLIDVIPGDPAAAAGLLVGDLLIAVNGEPIEGHPIRDIVERLRGPIDAPVVVTVRRLRLDTPLTVTVGRTRIVPDTIKTRRDGPYQVIQITSFNQRTAKRLAEALAGARTAAQGPVAGIILDLRGNPGGLLDQAVDSADLFLETGLISRADGRHRNSHQRFEAEPGDLAAGLPLVVLIDGASASAAEILASALQDQGRGVVIGMTSFGKGTIQTVITLPNGGELYLTWARFVAPSGYPLQRLGVGPTICTSGVNDPVKAVDRALARPENSPSGSQSLALRRNLGPDATEDALRAVLNACPWQPHGDVDIDLGVAKLLLDAPSLYDRAIELARSAPTS